MDTNVWKDANASVGSFKRELRKCLPLLLLVGAVFLAISGSMPVCAKASPKLNKTKLSLKVGKKYKLKLKNYKKKVKWSSSKKKVATVSKKGVVTAKKAGTATIKAKAGKKTYKCKVTVKKAAKTTTDSGKNTGKTPYIVDSCWKSYMEDGNGELSIVVSVCNPTDRVLYTPCVSVKGYDAAGKLLTEYKNINISYIAPHDTVTTSYVCATGDSVVKKLDLQLENGMDGSTNFYYVDWDSSKHTTTGKVSVTNPKMSKEPSGSLLFTGTLVNNSGFADLCGTVSLIFYKDGKAVFGGNQTYFNLKYAQNNEISVLMSPTEYQQVDPSWEWRWVAYPTRRSE